MATLTKRIEDLEAATPDEKRVSIIQIVPMRADGDDTPVPLARSATVNGQELTRTDDESEEAFFARIRANQRLGEVSIVF
ncbi:MAG: hypothetical protein AMXMBFR78_14760 [Rubrivivax sp.]|jgi:hypothetical protein